MLRTMKRYEKYKPTGMAWLAFPVIAVLSPSLPAPFVIAGFDRQSLPCRRHKMPDQVGHDEVVVGHDGCKSEVVSIIIIFAQKFCLQ